MSAPMKKLDGTAISQRPRLPQQHRPSQAVRHIIYWGEIAKGDGPFLTREGDDGKPPRDYDLTSCERQIAKIPGLKMNQQPRVGVLCEECDEATWRWMRWGELSDLRNEERGADQRVHDR